MRKLSHREGQAFPNSSREVMAQSRALSLGQLPTAGSRVSQAGSSQVWYGAWLTTQSPGLNSSPTESDSRKGAWESAFK